MAEDNTTSDQLFSRRTVLSSGAAITVGLAGCTGTETDDTTTESTTSESTTTEQMETTTSPEEPVAVPADATCPVCEMKSAEYEGQNAQVSHEDGTREFFCSPGCAVAYFAVPDHFAEGKAQDDIVGLWVHDYSTQTLVDGFEADYVLELSGNDVDLPMKNNPVPFAEREDALAFAAQFEELNKHDIVGIEAFDLPLARKYRASKLPESDAKSILDPVSVPTDAECSVCSMKPAEYEGQNAQISHEDGSREFFCSPGCAVAYYAVPDHFVDGNDQNDIVGLWMNDYASESLIDGMHADYVLELSGEGVNLPMKNNPVPFAKREDAIAFTDQFEELTKHDIVGIQAFDLPLALKYRAPKLPESDAKSILDSVSIPADAECAVCSMKPANFPDVNSQLSFADGERKFFCSPGCLTAFYGDPDNFVSGRDTNGIVGVWDHDYGTKEMIDADHASYVLETDGDRVDLPMKMNPVPFDLEADAVEYVDQYDDLTEDEIVSLLEFDRELAERYRGKLF